MRLYGFLDLRGVVTLTWAHGSEVTHSISRGGHLPAPQRSRQAGREAIFEDDEDRQRFLETLTEAREKTG